MYKLMKRICNKWDSGNTSRIKYIVWHYTAGTRPAAGAAKNNVDYYATSDISASAHYYVDEGETIWQSVEDKNSAWSVGGSYTPVHPYARNYNTLNIELCSGKYDKSHLQASDKDWYIPADTIERAIELTKDKMKQYGIPVENVIRHWDVCHKECPAPLLNGYKPLPEQGGWTWDKIKAALVAAPPKTYKRGDKAAAIKTAKQKLAILGFSVDVETTKFGARLEKALKQYQGMYGIKQSGTLDPATAKSIEVELANVVYRTGQSSTKLKVLKNDLSTLGYKVDTNTGKYGRKLEIAVKKYMNDYDVPGIRFGYTINRAMANSVSYEAGKKKKITAVELRGLTEQQVVDKIYPLVKAQSTICPAVVMAQFILESGYGSTELAVKANNCFGMKTSLSGNTWPNSAWDGYSQYTKKTQEEYVKGYPITITANFRAYPSINDSIADHEAYLLGARNGSSLRYAGLVDITDPRKAAQRIKDGGYATDSQYVDKLMRVIEKYAL